LIEQVGLPYTPNAPGSAADIGQTPMQHSEISSPSRRELLHLSEPLHRLRRISRAA